MARFMLSSIQPVGGGGRRRSGFGPILAGSSVATVLLVSASVPVSAAPVPGAASPGPAVPSGLGQPALPEAVHVAKLTAADAGGGDWLGFAVAVDGDTAVVGALRDDTPGGPDVGSAYVFVRSGTTWSQQAKLTANDGGAGDTFGDAVAIDGDTVVVGAPFDNTPAGTDAGSAYVFVRSGTTWSQQAKLTAADGGADDDFGGSVGVNADTAVVAASFDDTPAGVDAGSAYVYVRSGTTWTQQAKLAAADAAAGDALGSWADVDVDTAVVTAALDDTPGGTDAGSAYVFVRSGTTWSQQAKLTAADGAGGDAFGVSAAVSVDTAIVGAWFDDTPAGSDAGSAYVFVRSGTTWSQQAKLTPADGAAGDNFGSSVDVDGDLAGVGAWLDNTPLGTDAGSAYAFRRSGSVWSLRAKFTAPDGGAMERLGLGVSVSGTTGVIGIPFDDLPAGGDAGSAYAAWQD